MAITFKMAARTLRHLGAELITSEEMALNELIKNAFDANSPRVTIEINYPANLKKLEKQIKLIVAGVTSPEDAIIDLKDNCKSYYKDEENPTYFIEKMHELFINIYNTKKNYNDIIEEVKSNYYSIIIKDTGDGMEKKTLENVFLTIGTNSKLNKLSNNEERALLGEKGIGRLSMMRLGNKSVIQSKTENEEGLNQITFNWEEFNDPNLYLEDIIIDSVTLINEENIIKGTKIIITDIINDWNIDKTEKFVKEYIQRLKRPFIEKKISFPIDIIQNNKRLPVKPLPKWLKEIAEFHAVYEFSPLENVENYTILRRELQWRDTQSPEIRDWPTSSFFDQLEVNNLLVNNLGKFSINILWYNRANIKPLNQLELNIKTIKKELNYWVGGFSIYRDGFRLGFTGGLNDDWLRMDRGALTSQGFTFNRYQTIAEISISKENNPNLIDSANRQALLENDEFILLKDILDKVIIPDIKSHINAYRELQEAIALDSIEKNINTIELSHKKSDSDLASIERKLEKKEEKEAIKNARSIMKDQYELLEELHVKLQKSSIQNTEILELANLGQMADIISHELGRITENTVMLLDRLRDKDYKESDMDEIMLELKAQIIATEKRIKSIDLFSPKTRQKKDFYDITSQLKTLLYGYEPKFKRHKVEYKLTVDNDSELLPVKVKMVRGLVTQIIENILTNSVYWLQKGLKSGENIRKINIDIDSVAKTISIRDNGPGIAPEHITDIFKPYFTNRKNGKGLGLYIASQIAEYHGASLYLESLKEEDNRLRTFVIELPKEK
ncbi:ATP-binding protein [Acinetobacter lactucae]|uniref:ATP-binding protein n=1 Tax=Acinetobacter lactucae TaxID=1785128 RepID=UPI0003DF8926|nr:ATP-binding protein [Acinetobacter lactucae]ETR93220.1 histidine kinase-, DNA gyrase B-, and HSP90-like ATPase family protein [Acinetobacter lactucae]